MTDRPDTPDQTTTRLIWDGVETAAAAFGELQPRWAVPEALAIKADIGHHHRGPAVVEHALACIDAGACAVHLHIRDEENRDTGDIELWRDVVGEIRRERPGVLIDSGLRGSTAAERTAHLRERLFDIVALIPTWDADYLAPILDEARAQGVRPEFCVWDATDISLAKSRFLDTGLVDRPANWLIVPGTPYFGMPMPSPDLMVRGALHLVDLVHAADPAAHISFSAAGRASSSLTALGILLGHHVRPGIGETPWRFSRSDELVADPAVCIADVVDVARGLGRRPATPDEYRAMIGAAPLPAA